MKEQEILENNKLIAEWFGYKVMNRAYEVPYIHYEAALGGWYPLKELADADYHKSWDALMPVIEKIETMSVKGGRYSVSIIDNKCVIYNMKKIRPFVVSRAESDTKLSATYQAIVSFIKQVTTP